MKSFAKNMFLAVTVMAGVCATAGAGVVNGPLKGEIKYYFSEHNGTTESITIDIPGVGLTPTGPLTSVLDLTHPENSFEILNFDTMTVREEVDVILSSPLIDPIRIHAVEKGTFVIDSLVENPDGTISFQITTTLSGEVVVPPGSPFEGWIWRNAKNQTIFGQAEPEPDGSVGSDATKTLRTSGATIVSPDGTIYPTVGTGDARMSTRAIPEPSSALLLITGLLAMAGLPGRRTGGH